MRCSLNASESRESNIVSTNSLTVVLLLSPLTDTKHFFNRVVISDVVPKPLENFFKDFNSTSISFSSLWVNNLKVIGTLEAGKVYSNSFLPPLNKE